MQPQFKYLLKICKQRGKNEHKGGKNEYKENFFFSSYNFLNFMFCNGFYGGLCY